MSQALNYQIDIKAPRGRVWQTMLDDAGYREWTQAFCEGSYFEGRWETGADMLFLGPGGGGMRARLEEVRKPEYVSIQHLGELRDGKPTDDPAWQNTYERYWLSELDGGTTQLKIGMTQVPDEYVEMMNTMWPVALARLKAACER